MTLVLSLANELYTVQVSDRRVTYPSHATRLLPDDSRNKAGVIRTGDARLAYAITGLTDVVGLPFNTMEWLKRLLLDCCPPDYLIEDILGRFEARATHEFQTNRAILAIPPEERRLSVMLSGYWNTTHGLVCAGWVVTNFQRNFDLGSGAADLQIPTPHFSTWRWHATPPMTSFIHVERLGQWRALSNDDVEALRAVLARRVKPYAVIGLATTLMQRAAERSPGIGPFVSTITIPGTITDPVRFGMEANRVTTELFAPDCLEALPDHRPVWISLNGHGIPSNGLPAPMSVPRMHARAPCPCQSGKRYGECHRRQRGDIPRRHQHGRRTLQLELATKRRDD